MNTRLDQAMADIRAEREGHAAKGWTFAHDLTHGVRHLLKLAERYTSTYSSNSFEELAASREALVKAGSLIAAAIEVVDCVRETDGTDEPAPINADQAPVTFGDDGFTVIV